MIDQDSQFHSGIPYGHRSGPSSLLITRLADFLFENELAHFTRWLNEKREAILSTSKLDREWLQRHEEEIRNGQWDNLYLPRRIYGQYLRTRAESAIRRALKDGTATVEYITADITDVVTQSDGSTLLRGVRSDHEGQPGAPLELRAVTTVLSIGFPPVKPLNVSTAHGTPLGAEDKQQGTQGYVADIHAPSIEDTLSRIRGRLLATEPQDRRILVVGGNADALEFVLASDSLRRETGTALTVLSTRGRPYYWRHEYPGERPDLADVGALLRRIEQGHSPTAEEFYAAVEADVATSISRGSDKATVSAIMEIVGQVIGAMDDEQRAEMAGSYGIPISNLLRQAGGDAIDLLDAAAGDRPVVFEPGRFDSAVLDDELFTVTIRTSGPSEGSERTTLSERYPIIINATGFESVAESRSPLLQNMLATGTATASSSGAGLATDGRFRTAPGVYVLGPLLSGFNHDGMVIWHAESVNRIIHLAAQLAPGLVDDTIRRRGTQPRTMTGSAAG